MPWVFDTIKYIAEEFDWGYAEMGAYMGQITL